LEPLNDINIETLYTLYHKKVFNIALNMIQSIEDAEDITQEVFIEIHRSAETFKGQSLLSTWIYRITVNKTLDFIKAKKSKKRFAFITHLFHPESGEQLHEADSFIHPGVSLEQKENARFLYNAINTLHGNQKAAFVLSQVEHLPQKEIAGILNLGEKAVESLIQRAKTSLRKELSDIYDQQRKQKS